MTNNHPYAPVPNSDKLKWVDKCIYPYKDENGKFVFQVHRQEAIDDDGERRKRFLVCHFDDDGKAVWNMEGVREIPYRLDEFVARNNKPPAIAEGEKDVDTLNKLGFAAMCNRGGWGNRNLWTTKLWKFYEGLNEVSIFADNDEPGGEFTDIVARALATKAGVKRVKVVHFDATTKQGYDVSDYYTEQSAAGHTDDEIFRALLDMVNTAAPWEESAAIRLEDLVSYMPSHDYIFIPTREFWPAGSVNSRLKALSPSGKPMKASEWLDKNQPVEQMTWSPGDPMLIRDRIASEGGWIDRPGCNCFNLYRPPREINGDATQAGVWLEHIKRIYPEDYEHIVMFLAHRVQRPAEKINHALVLGGSQGIGKDTLLDPVKEAIGPWNFVEISPSHLLGGFNGFAKSVVLRISEARDLGEVNRYSFYEHLKVYTASPPDVIRCNEKFLREHYVPNVCGVIITTNHKTDGVYLPVDDRRHFIAWSNITKEDISSDYWKDIYRWYEEGGRGHVVAYLKNLDLSKFNAKEPPPKTAAFWEIVHASQAPEHSDMRDAIEVLGNPPALTLDKLKSLTGPACIKGPGANHEFSNWLNDRRNARAIVFRLEECGYTAVKNPDATDGRWRLPDGKKHVVYVKATMCERDRIKAAKDLAGCKF